MLSAIIVDFTASYEPIRYVQENDLRSDHRLFDLKQSDIRSQKKIKIMFLH